MNGKSRCLYTGCRFMTLNRSGYCKEHLGPRCEICNRVISGKRSRRCSRCSYVEDDRPSTAAIKAKGLTSEDQIAKTPDKPLPDSGLLGSVPLEATDMVRCDKFHCSLMARSCAARQLARDLVSRTGALKVPLHLEYCGSGLCAQGREYLVKLGDVVPPTPGSLSVVFSHMNRRRASVQLKVVGKDK